MSPRRPSGSLVDQVYEQVLPLLYNRGLTSAEILNAETLASSLGVSRTPVNMALVRLESEGLLRRISGKGWAPMNLTLDDINEIFDLKDQLEPLVARRAAERVTTEAATQLLRYMEEMEKASEARDLGGWLAADRRYHNLLFDLAGNGRLRQFQEQLNNQLYRLWVGHAAMAGQMAKSCAEHRLVAEAIARRDPSEAEANALKHVRSLRSGLLEVVENVLIPFLGERL